MKVSARSVLSAVVVVLVGIVVGSPASSAHAAPGGISHTDKPGVCTLTYGYNRVDAVTAATARVLFYVSADCNTPEAASLYRGDVRIHIITAVKSCDARSYGTHPYGSCTVTLKRGAVGAAKYKVTVDCECLDTGVAPATTSPQCTFFDPDATDVNNYTCTYNLPYFQL